MKKLSILIVLCSLFILGCENNTKTYFEVLETENGTIEVEYSFDDEYLYIRAYPDEGYYIDENNILLLNKKNNYGIPTCISENYFKIYCPHYKTSEETYYIYANFVSNSQPQSNNHTNKQYTVTIEKNSNDYKVKLNNNSVYSGNTVKFEITKETSYTNKKLTIGYPIVRTVSGTIIPMTQNGNVYTFTMPASDVTITALFDENYSITNKIVCPTGVSVIVPDIATYDDTVYLTVNLPETLSIKANSFIASYNNGENIILIKHLNMNYYTFKMPAANVEIYAEFETN